MKNFCFKLYNSKKNKYLHAQIDLASEIYNHFIALHRRFYRLYKRRIQLCPLINHITKLKQLKKHSHWKLLNAQATQDIIKRIYGGYNLFFRNRKRKIKTGPPSFRKRSKYHSITFKQNGYKLFNDNRILIAGVFYKFFKSREIKGKIKTLTVKRDNLGDFYIYIVTDAEDYKPTFRTGKSVGFDFGLKTYLTASDGNDIISPLFFKQYEKQIRKANRALSKKKPGSHNRYEAKTNLAKLHKYLADSRNDFHWKLANELTDKYDAMFFENLNMKAMQKLWGKKISDLAFSSFLTILKYVASVKGKSVFFIDRFEPSSKTCSVCGYINKELKLRDREWHCPECDTTHDRDRNAAYNILKVGASTFGLGDVRPVPSQMELAIPA